MIEFDTEVTEVIQRTRDVISFRFRKVKDITFRPGQYFFVTIKIDGRDAAKHFSFSNSPTETGYIEFTKRITNSPFSKALTELKIGDPAKLRMPYGEFTFAGEYKKIAFLSGGIGITPIRSICKFITDKKIDTDMVLLYGNSREEDIIFREDLDKMAEACKKLRVIYTLTAAQINKDWTGNRGYIDDKMIKREMPDFAERVFYICGPPGMVEAMTKTLKDILEVPEDRIKIEKFAGY